MGYVPLSTLCVCSSGGDLSRRECRRGSRTRALTGGKARRAYGDYGEQLVADWYLANGYEIVARNWRCRNGELDIVVNKPGIIVFCEVKTRRDDTFGSPLESITWAKQRRIRQLATMFLAAHDLRAAELRFDAGSVTGTSVEIFEGVF